MAAVCCQAPCGVVVLAVRANAAPGARPDAARIRTTDAVTAIARFTQAMDPVAVAPATGRSLLRRSAWLDGGGQALHALGGGREFGLHLAAVGGALRHQGAGGGDPVRVELVPEEQAQVLEILHEGPIDVARRTQGGLDLLDLGRQLGLAL